MDGFEASLWTYYESIAAEVELRLTRFDGQVDYAASAALC